MTRANDQVMMVLAERDVWRKLAALEQGIDRALSGQGERIPQELGRDLEVRPIRELPDKPGLSRPEGRARLLHDLASIELQAMELALRTLCEFPEAPEDFRLELAAVARDEGRHLQACLETLAELKFPWGTWPAHIGLWQAVDESDDLIDRVLIVHRYLEGSGLDAGATIQRRLRGVAQGRIQSVVQMIGDEEIAHVEFGSRWFRRLCTTANQDPVAEFSRRIWRLLPRIPRRLEPLAYSERTRAGFMPLELIELEKIREHWRHSSSEPPIHAKRV